MKQQQKPTLPEAVPHVLAIYAAHSGGCCWHIVLDDGNVDDGSVAWVINEWLYRPEAIARCRSREACLALAEILPQMSRTQRGKLVQYAFATQRKNTR